MGTRHRHAVDPTSVEFWDAMGTVHRYLERLDARTKSIHERLLRLEPLLFSFCFDLDWLRMEPPCKPAIVWEPPYEP